MNLAERYGLPEYGGVIHSEPLASSLLLEMGLINKFHIPEDTLSAERGAMKCILDASDSDYYVAALRFHGFKNEADNGYGAVVMSKKMFTTSDVIAKVNELASGMDDPRFAGLEFIEVKHEKN